MDQVYVLSQVPIQTHEPYVSYFLSLDSPPTKHGKVINYPADALISLL